MVSVQELVEKFNKLQKERDKIRNIGIIAHVHHGKTSMTDSLVARAGMISEDLAGQAMFTWIDEEERKRELTIYGANVSMVHNFEGKDYLINLIDTPGHVDFGGHVTRAMRAVDGSVIVVCAVEGVMPQTETVLRQSLREGVKPILFINKVDRAIKELKLTPEKLQERFAKIIDDVNELIFNIAPKEFKEKWQVKVAEGKVAFGSAVDRWAMSIPFMKKTGLSFKDVLEAYQKGEEGIKELAKKAPLHEVLLDMVIKHLPSPVEAQKYRIPLIWPGDLESNVGKSLLNCDPNGPLIICITKVVIDPHAGEIVMGRVFSGTLRKGDEVYLNIAKKKQKVQQILVYRGAKRSVVEEISCGNIVGIIGIKGILSGETASSEPVTPFETIKHIFEPVVTVAVEAKNPQELPKLIQVLKNAEKEDPSLHVEINEETGEHLLYGLGELHLEITLNKIRRDKKIEVNVSPPIVVYRESVTTLSPEVEGKSPNKHNKFYITVEPLEDSIYEGIRKGEILRGKIRKKDKELLAKLVEFGIDREEAKGIRDIFEENIFIDATRGVVKIGEVIEMVIQAFEEVMKSGPIAREPVMKVKVKLRDCVLHEDQIHRGPAQVLPAVKDAIRGAFRQANPILYEPIQIIRIDAPVDAMGNVTRMIQQRRGQLLEIQQEGNNVIIKAKIPVAEMFGEKAEFTTSLRSATEGRGAWFLVDQVFEKVPSDMQEEIIKKIKKRKGLL